MGGVNDTLANLEAAIDGEGFEFQQMYPKFVKEAEEEGEKAALVGFKHAMEVEEVHYGLYSKALEAVKGGSDLPTTSIFVCEICGNTVEGGAEDKCGVCGAPAAKFVEIN